MVACQYQYKPANEKAGQQTGEPGCAAIVTPLSIVRDVNTLESFGVNPPHLLFCTLVGLQLLGKGAILANGTAARPVSAF